MRLSKKKIQKLYKSKNQSRKSGGKKSFKPKTTGRTRRAGALNLRRRTLKKMKGGMNKKVFLEKINVLDGVSEEDKKELLNKVGSRLEDNDDDITNDKLAGLGITIDDDNITYTKPVVEPVVEQEGNQNQVGDQAGEPEGEPDVEPDVEQDGNQNQVGDQTGDQAGDQAGESVVEQEGNQNQVGDQAGEPEGEPDVEQEGEEGGEGEKEGEQDKTPSIPVVDQLKEGVEKIADKFKVDDKKPVQDIQDIESNVSDEGNEIIDRVEFTTKGHLIDFIGDVVNLSIDLSKQTIEENVKKIQDQNKKAMNTKMQEIDAKIEKFNKKMEENKNQTVQ